MRNLKKFGDCVASCLSSPLPLSGQALESPQLHFSPRIIRSLTIVRKSLKTLTGGGDTWHFTVKPSVAPCCAKRTFRRTNVQQREETAHSILRRPLVPRPLDSNF